MAEGSYMIPKITYARRNASLMGEQQAAVGKCAPLHSGQATSYQSFHKAVASEMTENDAIITAEWHLI